MELDDKAKLASRRLSDAINAAAEESPAVADAIRELREIGYEPRLTFQLKFQEAKTTEADAVDPIEEDFTDEDRKALRRMLIRLK